MEKGRRVEGRKEGWKEGRKNTGMEAEKGR